jgi:hypothetical protein
MPIMMPLQAGAGSGLAKEPAGRGRGVRIACCVYVTWCNHIACCTLFTLYAVFMLHAVSMLQVVRTELLVC